MSSIFLRTESSSSSHLEALMRSQADFRGTAGAWREELVWEGGSTLSPRGARHIGPPHERVAQAIEELLAFAHREDVAPLVKIAIAHVQFETIHPLTDGNGRTGRALIQAILRATGSTRSMILPVSAGLLRESTGYFSALDEFAEGVRRP